jgi:hypothetical protein
MNYETFDRIMTWLIAAAVLIALALSFSARAEASTIAAAPCLKPAPVRHRARKPIASCIASTPALLAIIPPLAYISPWSGYEEAPVQQPVAVPSYPQAYISPWSGYDPGSFAFASVGGSSVQYTTIKPTRISNSYTTISDVNTTNISNVQTSSTSVVNNYSNTVVGPSHRPHAERAPEISGTDAGAMLTLLCGGLLVIAGKRKP